MAKLNQIIAVEKGVKSRSFQELTEAHHLLQKPTLMSGISRTYRPKDEEGEQLPPESTRVQVKAEDAIRKTVEILTELFDVTATKDWANRSAVASVIVDGNTLLTDVPVTYLLFLEKQLTDIHTSSRSCPCSMLPRPGPSTRPPTRLRPRLCKPFAPRRSHVTT